MTTASELLWYVSYGSNLLAERFGVYLSGGAIEGRELGHPGARDPSSWLDSRPVTLPHQLVFAGRSRGWPGGGSAFLDPASVEATALARGYLITAEQFQDVLAQESGRTVGTEVDIASARRTGEAVLGGGRYDRVLYLGDESGHPQYTFTSPMTVADLPRNPPSQPYADVIARGLIEAHGLTEQGALSYLAQHQR